MKAYHNSRDNRYREPFGAVPAGGTVAIAIDVAQADVADVRLRLWSDTQGERFQDMEREPGQTPEGATRWRTSISCDSPEILWYRFVIQLADGSVHSYGTQEGRTGGEGVLWWEGDPPSFQLTVYAPHDTVPSWYTEGVVYQVFPDRFARDAAWHERAEAALDPQRKGPARSLVQDWNTPVRYARDADGRIARWDFYGGSLQGIIDKLDYIRELGASVIYLNPIFEAASSHRYDIADYFHVDPMLGSDEDFSRLCKEARAMGIRIILDGVFNHVGRDSRYFNYFGNYPETGAAQSEKSPYREWFSFRKDGTWESWWGVDDLPRVDSSLESWKEFICGKDGVVRHWLRAGASGWRLEVADELDESLIREIYRAAHAEKEDALVIGEVWEDASNKISYGELRHYLLGDELDGVMDYPFREGVLDYLLGSSSAGAFTEKLTSLAENYPPQALACCLNLLGSHDRPRIFTLLGGAPEQSSLDDDERFAYRLDEGAVRLAKARLWLATLLQMAIPGVPSLYYGDEAGMQGYADPYNRGPFPWEGADADCATIWRNAVNLRRTLPVLREGAAYYLAPHPDVACVARVSSNPALGSAYVLVNRSVSSHCHVELPVLGSRVTELMEGENLRVENGRVSVEVPPLGSRVLWFCEDEARLEKPLDPGTGVLCHISSLPAEGGAPGSMGAPARAFCDMLADCGQHYWQVLPVNPTDSYGSPYAGISAFAGNTRFVEGGEQALDTRVRALLAGEDKTAFRDFCSAQAHWLEPYAAFMACKQRFHGAPWQEWPEDFRSYTPQIANHPELKQDMERIRAQQYLFMCDWHELRAYANQRDICIVGDMPIYVSCDSADVWAHTQIFDLDENGYPLDVSGAPPDAFSEEGQVWSNPLYRWDVLAQDGYGWWLDRLGRAFELYDYVRLDHFLGFSAFYCVPPGATGKDGYWRLGPGMDLFRAAYERFGALPIIAEDLGRITPAARGLMARAGFPGMDILQFSDQDVRVGYTPPAGKLVYPGTHDNRMLLSWVEERYPDANAQELARALLARCYHCGAQVVISSLQDLAGLDDGARMNTPGTAVGNWSWQATKADIQAARETLKQLGQA